MSDQAEPRPAQPPLVRKRRRPAVVCTECRRRKIACDRSQPCSQCTQVGASCVYHAPYSSTAKKPKTTPSNEYATGLNHGLPTGFIKPIAPPTPSSTISDPIRPKSPCYDVPPLVEDLAKRHQGHSYDDARGFAPTGTPVPAHSDPVSRQPNQKVTAGNSGSVLDANIKSTFKGCFVKSRVYGLSHWMSGVARFKEISLIFAGPLFDESSELFQMLHECKTQARRVKAMTTPSLSKNNNLRELLPERAVCDRLVAHYFRTFESVFRILHKPSFDEYYPSFWNANEPLSEVRTVILLLVCAIGTCFDKPVAADEGLESSLHVAAAQWIYTAQKWINGFLDKHRLTLQGVQCQCLLLVALQGNAVGGDLSWIAANSLLGTAMCVGLNRDPTKFQNMSPFQAEMRRRLWATTLELIVQTSLAAGMPPLVDHSDYDTQPPENLNDDMISPNSESAPIPRPADEYTDSSVQCALMRSLPLRMKVTKVMNDIQSELSFNSALQMTNTLLGSCKDTTRLFRAFGSSGGNARRPSAFAEKMVDVLVRRFVMGLNKPFASEADSNMAFYYSRKVCLDAALQIFAYKPDTIKCDKGLIIHQTTDADDWLLFSKYGRGIFRATWSQASFSIGYELIVALKDDNSPATSAFGAVDLLETIDDIVYIAWERVKAGETAVKGHVFFSCLQSRGQAMRAGLPYSEEQAAEAATKSFKQCLEVLRSMGRLQAARTSAANTPNVTDYALQDGNLDMTGFNVSLQGIDEWLFSAWDNDLLG